MHDHGTTAEQVAAIAVNTRGHASRNPKAQMCDPITIDDVLESRMIASPLHLLDCCIMSDGGAAVLRAPVPETGGHATRVVADAAMRDTEAVFEPQEPGLAALTDRVKQGFDPHRILNPGRMYAGV